LFAIRQVTRGWRDQLAVRTEIMKLLADSASQDASEAVALEAVKLYSRA